jgi:hypothetical protein
MRKQFFLLLGFHPLVQWITLSSLLMGIYMAQQPKMPNLEAQRAAMKKLEFLAGKWAGEARIYRAPGEPAEVSMTEQATYKLDGLILEIEGVGKSKADGKPVLQALGVISYDDESGTYHMRAFNDGRFLETEVHLLEDGKGFKWGFTVGEIKTNSVQRINEKGEWTEIHEITIGAQPARRFMELNVRRLGRK